MRGRQVRRAAHAVLVLCLCLAGSAHGLGLGGELNVRSALSQPLDAELALYLAADELPDEVQVRLADPDTYRRLGMAYHEGLPPLSFLVTRNAAGEPVIHLTSRQPLREPALELLLEVRWPGGQMVRDYALLLDPPALYQPPTVAASAPTAPAPASAAAPASTPPAAAVRESYGPVQRGETLSQIAQRLRPDGVGTPQMTVALFEANPHAFIGGNMNRLRWGVTLYMPPAEALTARSRGAAGRLMLQQQQALQTEESEAPAAAAEGGAAALPQAAAAPRLQLLAPIPADAPAGELQESLAQVRQLNQAVEVENEELRLRLAALEEQAQRMARQVLALPEPAAAETPAGAEAAAPLAVPAPAPLAVPTTAAPGDPWWRNPSWWVVVLGILLAISAVLVAMQLWRRNQHWEYRDLAQALREDAEAKERARQVLVEKARRRYS
jgi:pilus assembly protein FimV